MVSFAPGPSHISDAVIADAKRAFDDHIPELSHRSPAFSAISEQALQGVRTFLAVPDDYHIVYLPSASDAWHTLVANTAAHTTAHFVNGAFSAKAHKAATLLYKNAQKIEVPWGAANDVSSRFEPGTELITICYNETSTGIRTTSDELHTLRKACPDALLAVDVTSCAGAVPLPIAHADAWYFSVQKGFGIPPGLGILIISPRALEKSITLEKTKENLGGYWRLSELVNVLHEKNFQTQQTPNILHIHLLAEEAKRRIEHGGIATIHEQTKVKSALLRKWIEQTPEITRFGSTDADHLSDVIYVLEGDPTYLAELQEKARAAGHTIGNGYGKLKGSTVRIANFPQHTTTDVESLITALS